MQEHNVVLPLCIQLKDKVKALRHNLRVLPNGLLVCKIKLVNPRKSLSVVCDALIDTGAEVSLICSSIFDKLSFDDNEVLQRGTSTLDGDEMVPAVDLIMNLPQENWSSFQIGMYVKDFSKREEYQAIIGMNILINYQLVYNGLHKLAWLDEI